MLSPLGHATTTQWASIKHYGHAYYAHMMVDIASLHVRDMISVMSNDLNAYHHPNILIPTPKGRVVEKLKIGKNSK